MKLFLAVTDASTDAQLREVLEELGLPIATRTTPAETRAVIRIAGAVLGVWSPEDALAVCELAYAAGLGRPVYIVAQGGEPPWFCSSTGAGGYYRSPIRACAALQRDILARRDAGESRFASLVDSHRPMSSR